tara:strand:+ start:877 stop:1188 length:312 start_codon:yes stop_codon:yes gene_type:complete
MAKIDYNAVLEGGYEVRVGNEYELAEGKWGKLRVPTAKLQEEVFAKGKEEGITDLVVAKIVLKDLPSDIDNSDVIFTMDSVVVRDFFTLLTKIVKRLTPDLEV